MPVDIQEAPITHLPIADRMPPSIAYTAIQPGAVTERKGAVHEISWEKIAKGVEMQVALLKQKYPDLPGNEIDSIANILFGPFRLSRESLASNLQTENKKEDSARVAQTLVHGIFYAGTKDADPGYAHSIYPVVATMERLAASQPGSLSILRAYWTGVKTELALAKVLVSNGYKVELPNYLNVEGKPNEVLNLDVRSGIDLVAKRDGNVLLIDAKGRSMFEAGHIRTVPHINDRPLGTIPRSLYDQNKDAFDARKVRKFEVRMPVQKPFLSGLTQESPGLTRRNALASFARLNPIIENDIMRRLNAHQRSIK